MLFYGTWLKVDGEGRERGIEQGRLNISAFSPRARAWRSRDISWLINVESIRISTLQQVMINESVFCTIDRVLMPQGCALWRLMSHCLTALLRLNFTSIVELVTYRAYLDWWGKSTRQFNENDHNRCKSTIRVAVVRGRPYGL